MEQAFTMKYTEQSLLKLKNALEASWSNETSYHGAEEEGKPSLGQCLPTALVVQHFFPEILILKGKVSNGAKTEEHYWNGTMKNNEIDHIDLTWQQFPAGSTVQEFEIFNHSLLNKSSSAIRRYELLLSRVIGYLSR